MQRLIRSFNTLTDALKELLQEQYPDGIDSSHIKTVPTAKGELLRVIELRTADAIYLIKINSESRQEIEEYLEQDDDGDDGDDGMDGMDDADDDDLGGDDEDDDEEEDDADDAGEEEEDDED